MTRRLQDHNEDEVKHKIAAHNAKSRDWPKDLDTRELRAMGTSPAARHPHTHTEARHLGEHEQHGCKWQ